MAEYIEKEALRRKMYETCRDFCPGRMCKLAEYFEDDMEDLRTVELESNGKWVCLESVGNDIKFCSICWHEAYWDTDCGQQLFDFCPYCGADMRQEATDVRRM